VKRGQKHFVAASFASNSPMSKEKVIGDFLEPGRAWGWGLLQSFAVYHRTSRCLIGLMSIPFHCALFCINCFTGFICYHIYDIMELIWCWKALSRLWALSILFIHHFHFEQEQIITIISQC